MFVNDCNLERYVTYCIMERYVNGCIIEYHHLCIALRENIDSDTDYLFC